MSYQVLARKWRPKRFSDLVGQEHVVRALSNALKQQRLHHAYLFTGTRGVGKTTLARILAKSLNCERGVSAEPCGECTVCHQVDAGRFIDLLEIDAASNTGIDNIREVLENAQYAPTQGRYKVYIIDEVHMLSKNAFNAMLKTLEEPPLHVKFILATTDPQKVPVTVLSRCLQFSLRNMTPQQVTNHLADVLTKESVPFEMGALNLLGRAAAGSMRDALSLVDQAIAYGVGHVQEESVRAMLGVLDRRYLYALLDALARADGPCLMAEIDTLSHYSVNFQGALAEIALLLHQIALAQTVPDAIAKDEPEREVLFDLASRIGAEDIQLYYQIAIQGRRDLVLAPDEQAGFTMSLLRMLAFHPANDVATTMERSGAPMMGQSRTAVPSPLSSTASSRSVVPNVSAGVASSPTATLGHNESASEPVLPQWLPGSFEHHPDHQSNEQGGAENRLNTNQATERFDGNWPALVKHLSAQMGTARMLAHNAVLKAWTPTQFDLAVPDGFRHMAGRDYQEKLVRVLSDHFGYTVNVAVTVEELGLDTPAMKETRHQQEQRAKAQESLQSDAIIQQFVQEFNAVLLTETIQPI